MTSVVNGLGGLVRKRLFADDGESQRLPAALADPLAETSPIHHRLQCHGPRVRRHPRPAAGLPQRRIAMVSSPRLYNAKATSFLKPGALEGQVGQS